MRVCTVQSSLLFSLVALVQAAQAETTVTVCADPEPPPWTYWVRDSQGKPTEVFVGASVDIVRATFSRIGINVRFLGQYPWSRCLKMVEDGEVDFAMDGYFDPERAKRFAYSDHYNTLTPQVFYRTDKPVKIATAADLKKYRGCGMNGASYAHYGLRSEDLDLGSSYEPMIAKLKAGRCDYFVEELEVIAGYRLRGNDYLSDAAMRYGPVPGAKAPAKHLLTAINGPQTTLLPRLNKALASVVRSGEAAKAWKVHAGKELLYKP